MKTKLKTIKNLSKGLMVLALAGSINNANAQEKESKITVGSNIDGYFKLDAGRQNYNSKTLFTESHGSFEIGMASVDFKHDTKKVKSFVDLGAGKRADVFSSNDKSTEIFIKQAYVSVELIEGVSLTGGSWKKHIGYEQINAIDNNNYSMSYAFSNTNFFNTGLKLDYKLDKFNFMLGAGNTVDFKSALNSGISKKNYFGQFTYNGEKTKFVYGFQTTGILTFPTNAIQNDIIVEHKFNDKFIGAINLSNYNYNTNFDSSWNSVATYLKYKLEENLVISYRGEFFNSSKTIKYLLPKNYLGSNIISNTITGNYKIGSLSIIPELRLDYSNEKIFSFDNKPSSTNIFFLIGTTYKL